MCVPHAMKSTPVKRFGCYESKSEGWKGYCSAMPDKSEWRKKKVVGKEKSKRKQKKKQRELREIQQYHLDATTHLKAWNRRWWQRSQRLDQDA